MDTKRLTVITNLYLYNRHVNSIDDDSNAYINDTDKLRYIIDQTNELISKKCKRNFGLDTYKEWIPANGQSSIVVNNYPITNIKLLSTSSVDLMTVESSGFPLATVTSNNSSIALNSIDTTGTETTSVFNYSEYANVSSIVTQMDATSGWTVEVLSNRGDSLTQLIRPIESGFAVDDKVYMKGPYLGSSVRVSFDSDAIIETLGGWAFCSDVFIWYEAGYVLPICDDVGGTQTTEGNVPEGLTYIANCIIKDYLEQIDEDTNMKSERIGDYSYTRDGIISAIDRHWSDLLQYGRKVV